MRGDFHAEERRCFDCYARGVDDFHKGFKKKDSPFKDVYDREDWEAGWCDARMDHIRDGGISYPAVGFVSAFGVLGLFLVWLGLPFVISLPWAFLTGYGLKKAIGGR